jgi:hypothetical protein
MKGVACMMCHRTIEAAQIGVVSTVQFERARERAQLRTCHPPALSKYWDRKLTGILAGAMPDYGLQPGETSPSLGWSVITVKLSGRGGGGRMAPWLDF